jgi:hypothetical protein
MKRDKAVILGAGIAGLVAARVLAEHFKSVVIIDKDEKIGSMQPRSGVAQGAHLHVLLKRGQEILREFFPDIEKIFAEGRCPKIDWAKDTLWESNTGVFPRYASETITYSFSRPFLEGVLHSLVSKIPNVRFVKAPIEKLSELEGDIIVLAGGQNFPCNRFLGLDLEDGTTHLPIQITYRSVVYEASSLNFADFKQYYYQLAPPLDNVGAVICPIENGHAIATIVEYGPPLSIKTDFAGFRDKAALVPGGMFYKILSNGKPLTGVSVFHKAGMYMRRPQRISNFPENVFCIGDIFCSLNPVFGQGMTGALIQAKLLSELLKSERLSSKSFHQKSANQLRLPYLLSKFGSQVKADFFYFYLKLFLLRCQKSRSLHKKFLGVLHLKKSYASLADGKSLVAAFVKTMWRTGD